MLIKKGVTETRYPSSLNFANSINHGRKRQHGNARECIHVSATPASALAEEPSGAAVAGLCISHGAGFRVAYLHGRQCEGLRRDRRRYETRAFLCVSDSKKTVWLSFSGAALLLTNVYGKDTYRQPHRGGTATRRPLGGVVRPTVVL